MVIFSFGFQLIKHLVESGEVKFHSLLMIVTFAPFALVFVFNYYKRYKTARLVIIIYTLINNLFWAFTNIGQDSNIYYSNVILAIPIVIFFRKFKTQAALICLTFIFFSVSYFVDTNYPGYIIRTYQNPNFNIIAFGIWLAFSFLMMRFFLQEIDQAEARLQKQNIDLEDFTRLASHDMKEPLRNIISFSSLIKSKHLKILPKEVESYLSYIETNGYRLNELLDGLSSYNQINFTHSSQLEEVSLESILNDLTKELKSWIRETNAIIEYDKLPIIKANPSHMKLLFRNLITNAIKFQPKNDGHIPIIKINYKEDELQHKFSFEDNGIGISEAQRKNVFKKFKKLHSRKEYDGTGLGLATCEKIIALYRGQIHIVPEKENGTTICFTIPINFLPNFSRTSD